MLPTSRFATKPLARNLADPGALSCAGRDHRLRPSKPERLRGSRAAGEPALKAERIQLALDVGRTGVWVWNPDSGSFTGDSGVSMLWGLPRDAAITAELFQSSLNPEDAARVGEELKRAAAPGGPDSTVLEFRIKRNNDGAERWIALQGRRFRPEGAEGPLEIIGLARDVTARKEREHHMHLLMREVTHRSKNLLAIIQAMARQTVKDSLTASEFEERFSTRLRGLAASHDLLAARDWHGAAMDDLARWQLGSAFESGEGRVTLQGPAVFLKPEAAQNIGLAFNELASNAARFGALSKPAGRVSIEWSIDPEGASPRRLHVDWRESGGPAVAAPQRYGFGHKVMERLAARALDGTVSLTFEATGLHWSLHIPASFVVAEASEPSGSV